MLKLDFGCGEKPPPGFIGMDTFSYPNTSIVGSILNSPFKSEVFDEIRSYHVIEHIERKYYGILWEELARICKKGAVVTTTVPYWSHYTSIIAGHVSFHNEDIFEIEFKCSVIGKYFECVSITFKYEDEYQNKSEGDKYWARKHLLNTVKEMTVVMKKK